MFGPGRLALEERLSEDGGQGNLAPAVFYRSGSASASPISQRAIATSSVDSAPRFTVADPVVGGSEMYLRSCSREQIDNWCCHLRNQGPRSVPRLGSAPEPLNATPFSLQSQAQDRERRPNVAPSRPDARQGA